MTFHPFLLLLTALVALPILPAAAAEPALTTSPMATTATPALMDMPAAPATENSVEDPFGAIMMGMQNAMSEPSGDIDADFVRNMIPHHQAAVDMAKVELERGHDPFARKLATSIMQSQQKEIDAMKQWLAAHEDAD